MNTKRQRQSSWPLCRGTGAAKTKNRHGAFGLQVLVLMLLLLVGGGSPAWATDYVLDKSQYGAEHKTDHLELKLCIADLDYKDTYVKEGVVKASWNGQEYELVWLKFINDADEDNADGKVRATLLMDNLRFTAPQLPDDIDSRLKDVRWRECVYAVQYTFFRQDVTPCVYRVETDRQGSPKSGAKWSLRGKMASTKGGSQTYTDEDKNMQMGTYYKYMVVNVPTDWIGAKGISESQLNSPEAELTARLGTATSGAMSTQPHMDIYNLQQDTTVLRLRQAPLPAGQAVRHRHLRGV